LVKWERGAIFVSSTHALLPRRYNLTYDNEDLLSTMSEKVSEEVKRGEHFAGGREYRAYSDQIDLGLNLWTPHSAKYEDWRQLVALGLMSRGGWM
ncbi:MAG: glycosyltransferase family 2 protein, partial [Paracoccaceae bacterium]|nr:glycosyltransferase family 2 protein [Paracoccaceae bacterium]